MVDSVGYRRSHRIDELVRELEKEIPKTSCLSVIIVRGKRSGHDGVVSHWEVFANGDFIEEKIDLTGPEHLIGLSDV